MDVLNVSGGVSPNGREQTLTRLEEYFPGHEITWGVFDSQDTAFERLANNRGIETKFFGPSITDQFESVSLLPGSGYPRATGDAIREYDNFDLVHVYGGPLFHGPIGAMYAAASRCPLITRFNGYVPLPDSHLKRAIVRGVITGLLNRSRVVFNSHTQKSDILSSFDISDRKNIKVIPPGVEEQLFEPVGGTKSKRESLGVSESTSIIGSVLTPRPIKRLDRAFEILSSVSEIRNIIYIIIGDSNHLDDYRQLAKRKGVADIVYWAGYKKQKELAEWYSLFDATILTSEWESFGMSITESYLCGTPCIAFDVGGMSDQIINEETGSLIEPYDLDQFSIAINKILSNEERSEEFSVRGMEYVKERFTLASASNKYQEMIQSLEGQ